MAESDKLFLLGVGAQKAGTTWLFHYLDSSGLVATNNIKEYHIWDAMTNVPSGRSRRITKEQSEQHFEFKIKFFLQQSPENYFNYFAYILQKQDKHVTCDITPSYAALGRSVLSLIRNGFEKRSIRTRTVFFMRDPVERIWSSARMKSINHGGTADVSDAAVLAHAMTTETEVRTCYDRTVQELESVFDPSAIHLGLYENMFELPQLTQLSSFCGVPLRPELVEKKVNLSPKARQLADDTRARIAGHYREVYRFAASRFPEATKLWAGFNYL